MGYDDRRVARYAPKSLRIRAALEHAYSVMCFKNFPAFLKAIPSDSRLEAYRSAAMTLYLNGEVESASIIYNEERSARLGRHLFEATFKPLPDGAIPTVKIRFPSERGMSARVAELKAEASVAASMRRPRRKRQGAEPGSPLEKTL